MQATWVETGEDERMDHHTTSPADPRTALPPLPVRRGATVRGDEAAVSRDPGRGKKDYKLGPCFHPPTQLLVRSLLFFPHTTSERSLGLFLPLFFSFLPFSLLLVRASWRVPPNSVVIVQELAAPQRAPQPAPSADRRRHFATFARRDVFAAASRHVLQSD